jgi:transcriptional regulator with XRE-family HTH domain
LKVNYKFKEDMSKLNIHRVCKHEFREMIKNTLGRNLTLTEFSKRSGVSLRTLNRLMKADETYSPNQTTLKRLEYALDSTKTIK